MTISRKMIFSMDTNTFRWNKSISFMLYGGINLYFTVRLYFSLQWKYNCYASVSMTLTLFCTPAYFNKRNLTFIKLGTNDVNMTTSWRYYFPRFKVFGCFSLKETENLIWMIFSMDTNTFRWNKSIYFYYIFN